MLTTKMTFVVEFSESCSTNDVNTIIALMQFQFSKKDEKFSVFNLIDGIHVFKENANIVFHSLCSSMNKLCIAWECIVIFQPMRMWCSLRMQMIFIQYQNRYLDNIDSLFALNFTHRTGKIERYETKNATIVHRMQLKNHTNTLLYDCSTWNTDVDKI